MADANNQNRQDFRRGEAPAKQAPRPRDQRNATRLRRFLEKKNPNPTGDWADEPDFSNIKAKRFEAKPKADKKPKSEDTDLSKFRAKKESVPKDEPLYDIGGCSASYPITEKNCMNWDLGGFIILLKQTYEAMRTVEQRIDRQMPFCLFQHHCCVYLNAVLYDRIREQGGMPFGTALRCQDAIQTEGAEYLIPEVIQEYVRNVGKYVTSTGVDVYVNVPDIARPQPPTVVEDEDIESGFFGPANADTHNVYECYIAPAITARYVEACGNANADWIPLPQHYIPEGSVPTFNLLGYDKIQPLDLSGRARCQGLFFPDDDTVEGRLRFSPELSARVNTFLIQIGQKFKSSPIPKETKVRTGLSNAVFVETPGKVVSGGGFPPLSYCLVNLYSSTPFGAQTANHAYLDCMHRRRLKTASGSCFVKVNGAGIVGWTETRNHNFEMVGLFAPTNFTDYQFVRQALNACNPGRGRRIAAIDAWVKKLEL